MTTLSDSHRYDAVRARQADSRFVFAVCTTGIACRCGCPSRTPAPQNVVFFDDFAAAERTGFRACKRCAPGDVTPHAERDRLIAKAYALLDSPDAPSIEDVAAKVGLSRFYFARMFRTVQGTMPDAYRRPRRDRRFRAHLATGGTVTKALLDAGYGSASRAYDAQPLSMTPTAFKRGAKGERIAYATAHCALGRVIVAFTNKGVCAIELGDDDDELIAALHADFPHADLHHDEDALGNDVRTVVEHIARPSQTIDLALDVRGTAFQQSVWVALRAVKLGNRTTYASLAHAIGKPGAARAIGSACAANKLAVAIPSHRVTRADGELSGYRWGTQRKRRLLEREHADRFC